MRSHTRGGSCDLTTSRASDFAGSCLSSAVSFTDSPNVLVPKIVTALKGYNRDTFLHDLSAGIICTSQIKDLFGLQRGDLPPEFLLKWQAYFADGTAFNPWAIVVSAGCLLIIGPWPQVSHRKPGSFVALMVGPGFTIDEALAKGEFIVTGDHPTHRAPTDVTRHA